VTTATAKKPRDPRLDFFRGVSLLAIFFAHVPGGWAREFIWARFGLSDAAHVFVFISGFAAAIAFGGSFAKLGFATGTARIAWRVCQLYACHLALFFLALFLVAAFGLDYAVYLGVDGFFADPAARLVELFTLRYVPTYFDILPLYMVVLASVPLVMALARIHPGLVIALSVASWSFVQATGFNLPAGEGRSWGFNPFAWQLIFLAGYAFSRGWIQAPQPTRALLAVCFAYLAFGAIAEVPWVWTLNPDLEALHEWAYAHAHKPNLDLRQFAHFLALAFVRLGRQALPVFFAGMALSHLGGIAMGALGTGSDIQIVVHVLGVGGLFAVAEIARYVKNAPWKTGVKPPPAAKADAKPTSAPVTVPSVAL
jgi:hypothetical protein